MFCGCIAVALFISSCRCCFHCCYCSCQFVNGVAVYAASVFAAAVIIILIVFDRFFSLLLLLYCCCCYCYCCSIVVVAIVIAALCCCCCCVVIVVVAVYPFRFTHDSPLYVALPSVAALGVVGDVEGVVRLGAGRVVAALNEINIEMGTEYGLPSTKQDEIER